MKRISLLLLSLLWMIPHLMMAQEQIVTQTTVMGEDSYVTHYLYDAQARPFMLLTDGLSLQFFTYNEAGQYIRQDYTDFTEPNKNRTFVYTYNAAGQIDTEEEFIGERSLSKTTYSYDAHGNVASILNSNGTMAIQIQNRNTYDETGHLIKEETLNPMDPTKALRSTEYTYEGELVMRELHCSSEDTTIILHSYDEAGLLVKSVTTDKEDVVLSTTTYAYADIDVSFAPYNVQAVAGDGNTITVTWEGTANAVVVDGKFYQVTGNTFTTPVLIDGTYTVYVVNNGNATASEPLDLADNTKVGVSDVRLNGDVTISFAIEQDRDGNDKEVTYYNLPIAWTLPAGAKPIGYRIYYNDTYYIDVEDGSLREYTIPAKNIKIFSFSQMKEITLDFVIRIVAIYETGEMEPANTLPLDTEAILELAANMQNVRAAAAATEVYTLDGIRMPSHKNLRPGTYVFRRGKLTRKVQTR